MIVSKYILVFFLWALTPLLHPLHLTVSNIEFSEDGKSIQVSIKVFIDDFETVLSEINGARVKIVETEGSHNLCDSLIELYIKDNFKVSFNHENEEKLNFVNKDQNEEAIILKYEIVTNLDFDRIIVENSILTNLYGDQKNLVFVVYKDKKVGYTLNSDNIRFVFELGD